MTDCDRAWLPFSFLDSNIKAEVTETWKYMCLPGTQERVASKSHKLPSSSTGALSFQALDSLVDGDWRVRTEVLLALTEFAAIGEDLVCQSFALAVNDPDACTRGAAWHLIGTIWKRDLHRRLLEHVASRLFIERMGWVTMENALIGAVRIWLDQIADCLEDVRRASARAESRNRFLARHAGDDVVTMGANVAGAVKFLEHPDARRRIAALYVIQQSGLKGRDVVEHVRAVANADTDSAVRVAAVRAFAILHLRTRDMEASRFLAELALDDGQSEPIRYIACEGLYLVHGMPPRLHPIARGAERTEDLIRGLITLRNGHPSDVDWKQLVNWDFIQDCWFGKPKVPQ